MSRSLAGLAAALALALAACGGSGSQSREESAPPPTTQKQATAEVTTTTTTTTPGEAEPEPITAAESDWLGQVQKYHQRLERAVGRSTAITHATMRRSAQLYSQCGPLLRGAGDAGRFEPARLIADRACERLRKAARLLQQAIASSEPGGFVYAGTPEETRFNRALGGAMEATGNAQYDLQRAIERAKEIERRVEWRSDPSQENGSCSS